MQKIVFVINTKIKLIHYHINPFQIDQNTKRKITHNLMDHVSSWNGVNSKQNASGQWKGDKSLKKGVADFWNHHKAEKLGTHLFNTIICNLFLV